MARANGVREIWAAGKAVINSWLGVPSSFSAEVMAHAGWDSLVVDMQHGMIDYSMMVPMLQGISTTGTVPLVRVPWNDPAHIQKALDAGAYGIICPMINNRAEAEKFVGSMRYAPLGYRSSGPIRASLYGGADYHMKANDIVVAFGMIETAEAIDNLDEILSTPGLDAIYVGPSDLSISLGYNPGGDKPDEWMMAALKKDPRRLQAPQGAARPPLRRAGLCQEGDRDGLHLRHGRRRHPLCDDGRGRRGAGDAHRGRRQARRRRQQLQPVLISSSLRREAADPRLLFGEGECLVAYGSSQ